MTVAIVSQIFDGQIQGSQHTVTLQAVNQIPDGQIQQQRITYAPPEYTPPSPPPSKNAVVAAASGNAAPSPPSAKPSPPAAPPAASPASSHAPAPTSSPSSSSTHTSPQQDQPEDRLSPTSPQDQTLPPKIVTCTTNSTLTLTLSDSILTDSQGRTGYIASNYQFQFDGPPQSAALFTSGWSVCADGSLALGGQSTFWQCRSGEFYNLYDRDWAPQCSPVRILVAGLVAC
jgi:hypothetical protein